MFARTYNYKNKSYSTQYSQLISHVSTDWAVTGLIALIGREAMFFRAYGRSSLHAHFLQYKQTGDPIAYLWHRHDNSLLSTVHG